jgi:hypothetical protein
VGGIYAGDSGAALAQELRSANSSTQAQAEECPMIFGDCKVGMAVRFNDNDQFGIVENLDDSNRCTVRVGEGKKQTSKQQYDQIREADQPVKGGWVICFKEGDPDHNKAFVVVGSKPAAVPPGAFRADLDFKCKLSPRDGQVKIINGAFIRDFMGIAAPKTDGELFQAIQNRMPLIFLPKTYQSKDYCIAYRGDSREPQEVFADGFQPRREDIQPVFRTVKKTTEGTFPQFDIMTSSGVCASRKPNAAALFPTIREGTKRDLDDSYLYAFLAHGAFVTCKLQQQTKEKESEDKEYLEKLLQGQEIVIGNEGVEGQMVLVAFHLNRTWNNKEAWQEGCTYRIESYTRNSDSPVHKDNLEMIRGIEQHVWDAVDGKSSPKFVADKK